jgi:hypothetical protein
VDWAGFEPATSTMPTWRSYQTDLPARDYSKHEQKPFKHYASPREKATVPKTSFRLGRAVTILGGASFKLTKTVDAYKEAAEMNNVDIAMNFANVVNFLALILLMRTVLQHRKMLKGFSISGSFFTFVSLVGFEVTYYLMGNMISLALGSATVAFWFIVFAYSLKQKLASEKAAKTVKI